jgi:hypothetical protein
MKIVNGPKNFFGRTIYVSNHPASFMDPLAVASLRRPILFFMTRSDVFTPLTKPFLWACQMLPIYRQHDGGDTQGKNKQVFKKAAKVLSFGRNLLIFGEGFTDDTFIRSLKPVKKGAAKIGFETLDSINWSKKVYMAAVGLNYSNPNRMRSDLVLATSDRFCLNDYREMYEENPNKAITEVTRRIEKLMQDQITYVEQKDLAPFHENMMAITRKGMNVDSFDKNIPLLKRWRYSQQLAHWLNDQNIKENKELESLKDETEEYFKLLKRMQLEDQYVFWKKSNPSGSRAKEAFMMTILFPFALIGLLHCFAPYIFVKRFAEKSFKRKVFWGSVKLVMGQILMGLINIPYIFVFYYFVYPSWWLAFAYYITIGLTGLAAYMWFINFKRFKTKGVINKTDISKFISKRDDIEQRLKAILPKDL